MALPSLPLLAASFLWFFFAKHPTKHHSVVQIPVVTYRLTIPFKAAEKQRCHCLSDCLATVWSFWFEPDMPLLPLPPPCSYSDVSNTSHF